MNFDLSALDNLQEKGTAARNTKFAPKSRARSRSTVSTEGKAQVDKQAATQRKAASEAGPAKCTEQSQATQQEAKRQESIEGNASKLDKAAFRAKSQTNTPGSLLDAVAATAAQQVSKQQHSQPAHQLSVQSGAGADRHHDSLAAQLPAQARRQEQQKRVLKALAQKERAQNKDGPSSSGLEAAIVLAKTEEPSSQQGKQQRGAKGASKEKPVIDPSTMSLKAIIKCAYAQERVRMEEERRKKKEEEERAQAEGIAPQPAPAKPKQAQARAALSLAAPSMAPQVQVLNGRIVVVQNSLTVQAQAEDFQRHITVEDNPKLNSASYSNRINNDRWTPQETELFFKAIKLFGTDFSLMEKMFPGRQRKALKFKLRREYKDNQERVDGALSGKDCDAGSYQEVVNALHKHMETQDSNLILGAPAEDPDLADILRGPAAAALNDAEGAEAPDGSAASNTTLNPASHPKSNEQAAKPARAAGRRGRASAHASALEENADSAPAQQAAAQPRGAGRRKGKAPMATIAEETAVVEQPESLQPRESAKPEGAWGGQRRRRGAAVPESFTEGLDSSSGQLQEQSQHAGTDLQAAAADQHAAQHDGSLAQDATQTASALPKEATAAGTDVQKPAMQDRKVMPRLPAGRRKRQTPGAAGPSDSTGGQGPAKRAKGTAEPTESKTSTAKLKSRVELLAEAAGTCAAEWEEENVY